jgi:hypothetical protein
VRYAEREVSRMTARFFGKNVLEGWSCYFMRWRRPWGWRGVWEFGQHVEFELATRTPRRCQGGRGGRSVSRGRAMPERSIWEVLFAWVMD